MPKIEKVLKVGADIGNSICVEALEKAIDSKRSPISIDEMKENLDYGDAMVDISLVNTSASSPN